MAVKAKAETTIVDVTDAYSVVLSSETYTFIGGTAGASSGLSCTTDVTAFCGANLCPKIQIGTITCPTGISAAIANNNSSSPKITFKTTATISAACEATIPVVVDGITVNKKFSFAVAKTGAMGATGAKGDKGDTGAAGKGIKSTSITYQASASATTAPTGTWNTSIPATSTDTPYLWTKTVITYTDGTTSTSYSVSSTLDSVEIGGRNLLRNSNFSNSTTCWTNVKGNYKVVSDDTYKHALSFYTTSVGSVDYRIYYCLSPFSHKYGTTYALSFYAKASETTTIQSNVAAVSNAKNYSLTTKWKRYTNVYTATATGSLTFWPNEANKTIYITNVKLEYGNKATDWTPAPEDTEESITKLETRVTLTEDSIKSQATSISGHETRISTVEQTASDLVVRLTKNESTANNALSNANAAQTEAANAAKTATNYLKFSETGLIVGDMTASTLGKNVLIDNSSVNIRNNTTVLATFAENLIELGKNSPSTVIKLCGGAGQIRSNVETYNGDSYNTLEISSDYLAQIKAGRANAVIDVSSNAYIKLSVNDGIGTNDITMYPDVTYFKKPVRFENYIDLPNNAALYGERTNGGNPTTLIHLGADDNVHIGYNTIDSGVGETHIHGQAIRFRIGTAGASYKPYYEADPADGVADTWVADGYITNSGTYLYFMIPLGKPIIGNPTVTVSSMNGLLIRQNGKYLYGSGASGSVEPESYSASIVGGNSILVRAAFNNTTNVTNNDTCSVNASIAIEFD